MMKSITTGSLRLYNMMKTIDTREKAKEIFEIRSRNKSAIFIFPHIIFNNFFRDIF